MYMCVCVCVDLDIIWVVCYKHTAIWAPVQNCPLADSFFETRGVVSYGGGWRKDVVNQCLELLAKVGTDGKESYLTACARAVA